MKLYKNIKAVVCSPDEDAAIFFDIVSWVLQEGKLALYLRVYQDYQLRTSIDIRKENSFTLKKTRSRRYPAETMADVDHADKRALIENTPTQAEYKLHSL